MINTPKISILCSTYNHEKYIRQTLETFVMQKTNFNFEVLVHDDASTDGTQSVIKEFEEKYPGIVKSVFQIENQYSKGIRRAITKFLLPIAEGEYILLCNGDDYFTDENKLQIQADFLDKNPEYSMCFHPTRWFFENNEEPDSIFPEYKEGAKFTTEKLLEGNFMNTNAVMYRRQDYSRITKKNIVPGDWYLHLYHARFGRIGFINKVMAAYRRHENGIWWSSYKNPDMILKTHGSAHLTMYFELLKLYPEKKYRDIIFGNVSGLFRQLERIDKKGGVKILERIASEFPGEIFDFLMYNMNNRK
ncbi:MAG: glycosyltransferase [Parcubacteria group bacterium]